MKSAEELLLHYRDIIYPYICNKLETPVFPSSFRIPEKYKGEEVFYWKVVSDYPKRKGKYLRPALLCLTGLSMGADIEKLLPVASAMQVSEDWILIHDDFEDDSSKRRGKPSLHKMYGPELAVNAGDALHNIMWKILLDSREVLGGEKAFALADEFYIQLSRTTLGQMTELRWSKKKERDFSVPDWYFIADGKTSYYTIACPMRLGAIVAGADNSKLEKLARFGKLLGRAFQLTDDILDVTGDFEGRKDFAGDIYEGKITVLLVHLLRNSSSSDRSKLENILNKPRSEKTEEDVSWVINKMHKCGSIDYARRLSSKWKQKAENYFRKNLGFLSRHPYRQDLLTLVDFVINRLY